MAPWAMARPVPYTAARTVSTTVIAARAIIAATEAMTAAMPRAAASVEERISKAPYAMARPMPVTPARTASTTAVTAETTPFQPETRAVAVTRTHVRAHAVKL